MKRKKNSTKRKTKQKDKKSKIEAIQWIESEAAESNLIIDDRRDEYMMYRTNRKSFGNFNIAIERMQQESIDIIENQRIQDKLETNKESNSSSKPKTNISNKKRSLAELDRDLKSIHADNKRQKVSTNKFIKPQPLQ